MLQAMVPPPPTQTGLGMRGWGPLQPIRWTPVDGKLEIIQVQVSYMRT